MADSIRGINGPRVIGDIRIADGTHVPIADGAHEMSCFRAVDGTRVASPAKRDRQADLRPPYLHNRALLNRSLRVLASPRVPAENAES